MSELAGSLRSSQVLEGATLVGRDVLAASSSVRLAASGSVTGAVEAPEGATRVEIRVRDASGALVRQISVEPQEGLTSFSWVGLDTRGARATAGSYSLEAVAQTGGRSESLETLLQRRVDSVTVDASGGGLTLNTASGSLGLGTVRRVM